MKRLLLSICTLLLPFTAAAQPLEVVSSSPADGATGVTLETTVSITFSAPLHTEAMLNMIPAVFSFNYIEVEPDAITFTNGNRTMNVPVTHLESGDYSWTVFSALSADGQPLASPYVFNYTNEAVIGQHTVSGTVMIQPLQNGFAKHPGIDRSAIPSIKTLSRIPGFREHLADVQREMSSVAFGKTGTIHDPTNTVIFLLEGEFPDFDFDDFDDEDNGDIEPPEDLPDIVVARAGMVASEAGDYTVQHVRDGEYLPIAIRFRSVQPGFLFLDAIGVHFDDEGGLGTIVVDGESLTGIDIMAFAIQSVSAHEAEAMAREFVDQMADDAQLYHIDGFAIEPDGNGFVWEFTFYSEEMDMTIYMPAPMLIDAPEFVPGRDFPEEATPIPDAYLNSTAAVEIAEANGGAAYRAEVGLAFIEVMGGQMPWEFPDNPELHERHLWLVQYLAMVFTDDDLPGTGADVLQVFMDIETGEVIEVRRDVSSEPISEVPQRIELLQNYPNPFNPVTQIPFTLSEPGSVQLEIYDLLGRHIATVAEGFFTAGAHSATWRADGVSSGVYVYRLKSGDSVLSRRLVLMK